MTHISSLFKTKNLLKSSYLDTPLGKLVAIANDKALYLLEFSDQYDLNSKIERLKKRTHSSIILGKTDIHRSIKTELNDYFDKKLTQFKTPIYILGSAFQKNVWKALKEIPCGETRSYFDIAKKMDHPRAFRAVALANRANQLAIIIPCHRVINKSGKLGGYVGGVSRKFWLLNHEKNASPPARKTRRRRGSKLFLI